MDECFALRGLLESGRHELIAQLGLTLRFENCSLGNENCVVLFKAIVSDGSKPRGLFLRNCGIDMKSVERLGTMLQNAKPDVRQRLTSLKLQEVGMGLDISSTVQLLSLLTSNTTIDMFLIGNGRSGKTQLESSLRSVRGAVSDVVRTIGANSLTSKMLRRSDKPQPGLFGRFFGFMSQDLPRLLPPLGESGFQLGDVVEIGGQSEFRYLYRILGSLFRIHVILLRMTPDTIDEKSFENLSEQLNSHIGVLSCQISSSSAIDCPTILVAINCSAEQVCCPFVQKT